MKYRHEIDGLRALAVLPVILFHAGFQTFSGGFVGVDVFFVISGYLITTIILAELEQGKFSIVNFYERRARRILPALFLVVLVCLPFAWFWLLPSEMKLFAKSVVAVALFSSNILFWRESGYFDTAAELKPLLHTWSLAVEEQYYVLFPLFLMAIWRFGKRWLLGTLAVIAVISLAAAQWGSTVKPAATFFLLPTRGWELLIGAFVAFYLQGTSTWQPSRALREACGVIGLAMLGYAVFAFGKQTPFPSLYALVPTVGTALIILFATRQTTVGQFIGNKLFVGIGLISYSAYLWHQSVFVFARHRILEEQSKLLLVALAIISVVLAYLSWRFVERPFRSKSTFTRKQVFSFAVACSAVLVLAGLAGYVTQGFSHRERYNDVRVLDANAVLSERGSGERYCDQSQVKSNLGPLVCVIGDTNSIPNGVLWGDSLAGALMHGLDKGLRSLGHSFYVVLSDGCIPIVGSSRTVRTEFNCTENRHRQVLNEVLRDSDLEFIVWIGAFANLTGNVERDYLIDGHPATPQAVTNSIVETLRTLRANNKKVFFVGDTPRFHYHTANYRLKQLIFGNADKDAGTQSVARTVVIESLNQSDLLAEAANHSTVIDSVDTFCDTQCPSVDDDGKLLFIDGGHLSHRGSERLADVIIDAMFKLPAAR